MGVFEEQQEVKACRWQECFAQVLGPGERAVAQLGRAFKWGEVSGASSKGLGLLISGLKPLPFSRIHAKCFRPTPRIVSTVHP